MKLIDGRIEIILKKQYQKIILDRDVCNTTACHNYKPDPSTLKANPTKR